MSASACRQVRLGVEASDASCNLRPSTHPPPHSLVTNIPQTHTMNPTQIPFHSSFNPVPVGSLPAQPQIQPAPGGPAGSAHIMMMPPFQQQLGAVQVPNFLLQAFQQQNAPQWMLPHLQTPSLATPPLSQGHMAPQHPTTAASRQYNRPRDGSSSQDDEPAPIGSDPDDEEMLIKTLQKAKARGITPRKALDKLDKVRIFSPHIMFVS